jgi:hypothetical protein
LAAERNQVEEDVEAIIDDLYASKIEGSIEWVWDGGFYVSLGRRKEKVTAGLSRLLPRRSSG